MKTYRTSAGQVSWLEFGAGAGLTVLIHGAASSPLAFVPLAQALASAHRRVVCLGLHGYGPTALNEPDILRAHTGAVRLLLDVLEADRCALFGHSLGGLVALLAAVADSRVSRLCLYEPIALGVLDPSDAEDAAGLAWDRRIVRKMCQRVDAGQAELGVRTFVEAWNDTPWQAMPHKIRAALIASAAQLSRETTAAGCAPLGSHHIASLTQPMLLLHGTASPPVIARIVKRLMAGAAQASEVALAGKGHMAPVTDPAALAPLLHEFLTG